MQYVRVSSISARLAAPPRWYQRGKAASVRKRGTELKTTASAAELDGVPAARAYAHAHAQGCEHARVAPHSAHNAAGDVELPAVPLTEAGRKEGTGGGGVSLAPPKVQSTKYKV